jgi:transposase
MEAREERGLVIAATNRIEKNLIGWKVPSQSGNGTYIVNLDHGTPFCTCPDFEKRQQKCKHIYAVEFTLKRETQSDGKVTETRTVRVTYGQDWTAYNDAQTEEKSRFMSLLSDLCGVLPQPEQGMGRPRLPLSDMAFASIFKVYTGFSSRRFTSDMKEATALGFTSRMPHFNSVSNYLSAPELTPIFKSLVTLSSLPLKVVEADFAVDSSGFATCVYDRWYDAKYGKMKSENHWVKAHLMCGVKTHIVTAIEVTPTGAFDAPYFQPLVLQTAVNFPIREITADKAYSSRKNLHVAESVGATAYIPFRSNTNGIGNKEDGFDGLWNKMWHYYNFNRLDFMSHYHKRSNAETALSMIKAKFGGFVRSKGETAQLNEVICKVVCHNICVLIQSIHELGLEPVFELVKC